MTKFSDLQPLYAGYGIVTFPVTEEKRPAVRGYLKMGPKASREVATSKMASAPAIGFATNQRNRITVLDVDTDSEMVLADALDRHGHTPLVVRTGSGKFHAYYRHNGERRRIRPWKGLPIDLLGAGGYVVAPPSKVARGEYHFIKGSLDDIPWLPVLQNLGIDAGSRESKPELPRQKQAAVTEGQRNTELWRYCMRAGHYVDDFDALLDLARTFNQDQCQPPLEDSEVIATAQSAWNYTVEGRNWFGQHGAWLPKDEVNQMVATDLDAFTLWSYLKANQRRDATFMVANGLAEKFGWSRQRLSSARRRLIEFAYLKPLRQAGPGHPALFRWGK